MQIVIYSLILSWAIDGGSWRAWYSQQVKFMCTPLEWSSVLWRSHGVFRFYKLFLNLTITSGENNKIYWKCITGYPSRFSYIQSSVSFLIQEIKQVSAHSFPLSSEILLVNQEEATGEKSHILSKVILHPPYPRRHSSCYIPCFTTGKWECEGIQETRSDETEGKFDKIIDKKPWKVHQNYFRHKFIALMKNTKVNIH